MVVAIVAVDINWGIGCGGNLLVDISEDKKFFREKTKDSIVIMGRKTWALAVQMVVGLIVCYAFGTAWFMIMYTRSAGPVGLVTVLGWCVFPFIIPDLIKIVVALGLTKSLKKVLPIMQ